ncbi:MAG: hypothetical protein CFE24_12640 [Flavobacterium sp. BFFFF2]|nr:MAG: hypothetical protein CFE24_12640 [Flavobacterium sp. BFFFF2]
MINLLTLEIDNTGKIRSIAGPQNGELAEILPMVGGNFLSHWNEDVNTILKEFLAKVFTTPHAIELTVNLHFTIVDLTAFHYSTNKALVHCKYIETLVKPKTLPTNIQNWGFEENINAFEQSDKQLNYLDTRSSYRDIVAHIALGIVVINFFQDGSFCISYANHEFHKLAPNYDSKKQSENSNPLFEWTHPDDLNMVQAAVKQLFELKGFDLECRLVDDGQTKNIRLLGKPVYNKLSNLITAYIYFQDITEKKKIEQELRLVDHSFNTAKLPMLFLTREGEIYNYNDAICKLLGYSFEEFGKLTNIDFTTTFNPETWRKRFDDIKAKLTQPFETKLRRKDQTVVDVRAISNAFDYNGIELVFVSFFDITEVIKSQEVLKISEEKYK